MNTQQIFYLVEATPKNLRDTIIKTGKLTPDSEDIQEPQFKHYNLSDAATVFYKGIAAHKNTTNPELRFMLDFIQKQNKNKVLRTHIPHLLQLQP